MKYQTSVKHINYGIACRIGNRIYIHKNLKNYPELYERILQHELAHSPEYTKMDITMDLDNQHLKGVKRLYWKFVLSNPSSWVEFLPGWFYEGRFVLAPLTTAIWVFSIVFWWFAWRFIL